jgi:hypothetical protein
VAQRPRKAPTALDQAWRRLGPLTQLDLFEDKTKVAAEALAELKAIERRLKDDRAKRSA